MTIIEYDNGNCHVSLDLADGTKTRSWDGDAAPEFPESVDLKVTERCGLGCDYCHESASPDGRHAAVNDILPLVEGLPAGVELAIGGGNPLEHPHLVALLRRLGSEGMICNLTVHVDHAAFQTAGPSIADLRCMGLIRGVGFSGAADAQLLDQMRPGLIDHNTVLHFVVGVDNPWDAMKVGPGNHKILLLGYKRRGRGESFYSESVEQNIGAWRYFLSPISRKANLTVSYDNLAIEQLRIKGRVSSGHWNSYYMGDDGQFNMFVDTVRREFAASSADADRLPLGSLTIREAFMKLPKTCRESSRRPLE